jgi:hypothetical protein
LGLSLDRIAAHPGCSLAEARPLGLAGRCRSCLSGFFSGVARRFRGQPQRVGLPDAPPAQIEIRGQPEARLEPALPLPRALAPEPRPPLFPPANFLQRFRPTLEELKALHWSQQQAKTQTRIARLFSAPPPTRAKKSHHPRSPSLACQSSSSVGPPNRFIARSGSLEALEPLLPRRSKAKFYGVRVGRRTGVFHSWDECRSLVDGISNSEFRSFPSYQQAADWVNDGVRNRRTNMMNLSPSYAPTSFTGGRSLRAIVHVLQEGETNTYEHICCLDTIQDPMLTLPVAISYTMSGRFRWKMCELVATTPSSRRKAFSGS